MTTRHSKKWKPPSTPGFFRSSNLSKSFGWCLLFPCLVLRQYKAHLCVCVCVCVCVFKWAMINIYYFASKLFYSLMHQGHLSMSLSISFPLSFLFSISWRQWHPTPVLLPGKFHERRSLVGCSPWGREESDTTELPHFHFSLSCIGRKWQPTPVFLPGESQGRGSLVGCRLWGCTESDTTEAT